MKNGVIKIVAMTDWNDCEQCGGGSEDGGVVYLNGESVFEHIPCAGCFGNNDISVEGLLVKALNHLGYSVEISYDAISAYEDNYHDDEEIN